MLDTADAVTDGERAVVVTRWFAAPRASVWRAFTETGILARWLMGPPGWEMHVCQIDPRPGGRYHWRWRSQSDGDEIGFSGTYVDVKIGRFLVDRQSYDHGPDAETVGQPTENTVTFSDSGEGTEVVTRVLYADTATRDAVLAQGMVAGMEASFQRLDALLHQLG